MARPQARPFGLLMFTRYPEPGRTKTRLIPHLGPEGAADLQRQMTEHVFTHVTAATQGLPLVVEVHFAGGSLAQMQGWLGNAVTYCDQSSGSLGDRLIAAFGQSFDLGRPGAIAIGSDCPALGGNHLAAALQALERVDVAIGPATDGGYYLIGLRRLETALFKDIDWGTDRVLGQTLAIATAQGLTVELLTPLTDIDYPADLPQWERIVSGGG
ncbi:MULTISPECIES: TIGR04282 family arsenosugar biosynthesis glycosyltransferase [Cyanophyceae]|uniref:TIGR04282 family arsenosugar biosynthesis glycosyltransferase n=1 Tax=Cyanophyceae TaxID=3028117 RepID=UPI0016891E55|nr:MULTISPECIES: TIGR04282 family arsenosugar biosynthesis glycosyltransferase [Cyanophyceae]MBD1919170.1 TIGR04282 family arsenosugar biosynthesis glycosyltransferase [Phormidium sp. FACHB-77]MBD2028974.1 TIGR04282 family arsenosugar biosynthesis glycosyltransferase [Phormidium sp. FACHB-322]MBD2054089.1 TIGR04282 family arsenosugar biosynthesis glycosyltransferase [Leptolyngbya sp. FACHB-60]